MRNASGRKQVVGVVFGGRSVEHDVSIVSAQQVIRAMDTAKYEIVPLYVTREGKWLTGDPLADLKTFQAANLDELIGIKETVLSPSIQHHGVITPPLVGGLFAKNTARRLDVVFPVIHGTHGEDGTLQGLLELADLPYVGCGVLASAVANDKIATKALLRENNIPMIDYVAFRRDDWLIDRDVVLTDLESKLTYPMIVKPATLGSSIGIARGENRDKVAAAIDIAITFDRRILVESVLVGAIEINCALLGNAEPRPSVLEQPISYEEFLSFNEKYMRGGSTEGMKGAERRIPAPIAEELTKEIQDYAVRAFKAIDGRGTARIDFLVKDSTVYLNEINTMPGSLAFYLWSEMGMKPAQVVDELLTLARDAIAEKRRTVYNYKSGLVDQAAARGLKGMKK
jgi:D-alanine-D-alanine ligase